MLKTTPVFGEEMLGGPEYVAGKLMSRYVNGAAPPVTLAFRRPVAPQESEARPEPAIKDRRRIRAVIVTVAFLPTKLPLHNATTLTWNVPEGMPLNDDELLIGTENPLAVKGTP